MRSPKLSQQRTRVRILHFLWRLSETGGIQRVVRDLLDGLDHDRFEVHVCTVRPLLEEDGLDRFARRGVAFHSLDVAGGRSRRRQLVSAFALRRVVERVHPDVLHAHSGTAWFLTPWAVWSRFVCPVILEVHDSPRSGRVSNLNSALEKWLLRRRAATALVHSTSVRDDVVSAAGIAEERVEKIPIGIDIASFDRPEAGTAWRRVHGIGTDELVVSYVARLVPSKNVELFLRVAAACSDRAGTRFVVVGEGPERERLQALSATLGVGDRVLFTGLVADLAGVLGASDVFLSTSDYEGFGIAILEAMAARTAVVATEVGGTADLVISGQTGFLVGRGDLEHLAGSLRLLLDDARMRSQMADAGHARARAEFDVGRMVARYTDLYERAVGRRR